MPGGSSKKRRRRNKRGGPNWFAVAGVGVLTVATIALVAIAVTPHGPSTAEQAATAERLDTAKAKYAAEQAQIEADAAAAASAEAEAQKVRVTRPVDRPMNVLYAGDSLTYGLFSSVPEAAFRPLVTAAISGDLGVEEARGEKAGAGAGAVGNLVNVPENLDLAIVELGTNDTGGRTEIGLFEQQYVALMEKIKGPSPDSALLCLGTWGAPGGGTGTDEYDVVIERICEQFGGRYQDLSDAFLDAANHGPVGVETWGGVSDEFHPNDAGHRAIADLVLSRLSIE